VRGHVYAHQKGFASFFLKNSEKKIPEARHSVRRTEIGRAGRFLDSLRTEAGQGGRQPEKFAQRVPETAVPALDFSKNIHYLELLKQTKYSF
jgi:hypothetical protein